MLEFLIDEINIDDNDSFSDLESDNENETDNIDVLFFCILFSMIGKMNLFIIILIMKLVLFLEWSFGSIKDQNMQFFQYGLLGNMLLSLETTYHPYFLNINEVIQNFIIIHILDLCAIFRTVKLRDQK